MESKNTTLLVNPSQVVAYGEIKPPSQIHMGLAYLAGAIEKQDNVEIVDIDAENISEDSFASLIKNKHIDIVGFTSTTPTFFSSLKLAQIVKKHSSDTITVFGGIHPTICPFETIKNDSVDVVVKGEGEVAFKEISQAVKGGSDFSEVKGIFYKKNGKIVQTSTRPLIEDLDLLAFPARHLFKNNAYTFPDALYRETTSMITSRGCPGRCTYCNAHQIFSRRFRKRSAQNIVDEVEFLVKKNNIKEIHIWDDNFITDKKRVLEVRDEILRRKLKVKFAFPNGLRADFLNEEVLKALKDMGTYSIALGVESGSQEILNRANKGIKLQQIKEITNLAKKIGLEIWAFFIFGLPGENAHTAEQTIDFALSLNPDIAKFHILKPYPGSEVYDYLKSKNLLLTQDYDRFGIHTGPVHKLDDFSPADMLEWQKKAYKKFYLRFSKITEQILRIKTINRFKVNLDAGLSMTKMFFVK